MHSRQLVLAQVMAYLPLKAFSRMVAARRAQHKVQDFSCLNQLLVKAFAQRKHFCHRGLRCKTVFHNTLANASHVRPREVFADLAHYLIKTVRVLYANEPTNSERKA